MNIKKLEGIAWSFVLFRLNAVNALVWFGEQFIKTHNRSFKAPSEAMAYPNPLLEAANSSLSPISEPDEEMEPWNIPGTYRIYDTRR
jgi:hypothetical protein